MLHQAGLWIVDVFPQQAGFSQPSASGAEKSGWSEGFLLHIALGQEGTMS